MNLVIPIQLQRYYLISNIFYGNIREYIAINFTYSKLDKEFMWLNCCLTVEIQRLRAGVPFWHSNASRTNRKIVELMDSQRNCIVFLHVWLLLNGPSIYCHVTDSQLITEWLAGAGSSRIGFMLPQIEQLADFAVCR